MTMAEKGYCPKCDSQNVQAYDGTGHCQDCGTTFTIDLWKNCPDCLWKLRTSNTVRATGEHGLNKAAKRGCTNPDCNYCQTVVSTVLTERPRRGQGCIATLQKMTAGKLTFGHEEGPETGKNLGA